MSKPTRSQQRSNTRVLVITDDVDRSIALIDSIRAQSLDLQMTGYDGKSLPDLPDQAPSAVLCFLTDYIERAHEIVAEIRARYAPRRIPVIARLAREIAADHPFDSVLYAPVHPVQVAHRVAAMIRLGQMEHEIVRRMETLRESFGQTVSLRDEDLRKPFRILFVGQADPAYMAVVNALQGKNVDVVAAFTSFSAFDYLHDRTFDAVVMNALHSNEPALTITETMRRNPRLFHVPTLLLIDADNFDARCEAFASGARDLIDADSPMEEIAGRIIELANYHRLHSRLKAEFKGIGGADCTDPETGVFNTDFLSAHLKRVSRACRERAVPLSILTMKLHPASTEHVRTDDLRRAYGRAIQMISGLVRMQDIVARVDTDTVIVAFPEEVRASVETVLERMTGLIECAAFETSGGASSGSLTLEIEAAIIEQEMHESADMLIGNGIRSVARDGETLAARPPEQRAS